MNNAQVWSVLTIISLSCMTQCYMFPAILESENITESKYSSSSMFVCE